MNKQLLLPKTDENGVSYLSYSQISTWLKSKREYMRQYFFGEAFEGNAYTDFGSKVGEALEHNNFEGFEPDEQEFLKTIPRYDHFEALIKLQLDGFYIKGFIDTMERIGDEIVVNKESGAVFPVNVGSIADYKTGDIKKKKADYESEDYIQLEIYAAGVQQMTGNLPEKSEVFLIGREGNPNSRKKGESKDLTLSQEFITITREITPEKIEAVKTLCQDVAEEISAYYTTYLKMNQVI